MTVYASACIKAYSDFVYFNILAGNKKVPNRPVINTVINMRIPTLI